LVDVHVFKYRSLILKSHDKSNVEKVTGYLKRNASVKEIRSGVYLTAGAMDDTLHWSRLHRLDAVRKDPSRVNIGSTYLEKVPDRIFADVDDVYRLYYIYDKKHYPKISLDEDTLHSSPSSRTLKNEEYEERLQTVGARLRARSVVSDGGVAVYENEHYAVCPRK